MQQLLQTEKFLKHAVETVDKEQMYAVKERALVIGRLPLPPRQQKIQSGRGKVGCNAYIQNGGHLCG